MMNIINKKCILVLLLVCFISATCIGILYHKYRVTQPILVTIISDEDAAKHNIDFISGYHSKAYNGIEDMQGETVSKYVQDLGYGEDEAHCAFALKGHSIVCFEPQEWHGVYLTIYAKKEKSDQVYIYLHDPRYSGAWHLRHYVIKK